MGRRKIFRTKEEIRERNREYQRKYYKTTNVVVRSTSEYKTLACERQRKRRATSEGKERFRELRLLKLYNLTTKQWQTMFLAQGSCCAICKSTEPGSNKGWATDHCHSTGKVRGILCPLCNKALGLLKDNLETLRAAVKYLMLHRK